MTTEDRDTNIHRIICVVNINSTEKKQVHWTPVIQANEEEKMRE
jgi:hypothetical protein